MDYVKTEVLQENQLNRAAELMLSGHVVAFPTETVYGLGAPIFCEETVRKIFLAKGRPSDNPLIAHVSSMAMVEQIAREIPQDFYTLSDAFFPGPLTLVLKKHTNVPASVSAGLDTIALRMPSNEIARALIDKVAEPIVAPSANLSGRPSSTNHLHVIEDFDRKIAAVIASSPSEIGIESTVVSLLEEVPVILRPGHITASDLQEVLGKPVQYHKSLQGGAIKGPVASPGMKYRHYAPNANVILFFEEESMQDYISKNAYKKLFILFENMVTSKHLYAHFRSADLEGCDEVLLHCSDRVQKDLGLMNRILKASERL